MSMSMRAGLGDVQGCGDNPCGLWDYVWVSDDCANYLQCTGQPPMTFSAQLGLGLKNISSGTASALGQGVQGALSDPTTDIVLLGAVVLTLVVLAKVK
jgi:hypothetical protein